MPNTGHIRCTTNGNIHSRGQTEENTNVPGEFVPRMKFYPPVFETQKWPDQMQE